MRKMMYNNQFLQTLGTLITLEPLRSSALHKKRSFPFRISSVNVTKSAVSSGFGHLPKKFLMENFIFLQWCGQCDQRVFCASA